MAARALCFLLVPAIFVYAVSNVPTIGNDFVFTFFNAYVNTTPPYGVLLLALVSNNNNGTANIVVTSPYPSFKTIRVSVAPHSVLKIPITPESIQDQYPHPNITFHPHIVVEDKGIRLQSDLPVAVYAHAENFDGRSDSFLVIPAVQLGMQYVAVTSTLALFPDMIAVVAYQDNTQITIGTQTVTINALQVASVASLLFKLSGTPISGNKPFGAISGCTCGLDVALACDYEAVMLLPVGAWGTQFTAIPFMYLSKNYYQVVTNTNNTIVSAGGTIVAKLNQGEYRRIQIGTTMVTSNHPILLIQMGEDTGVENNEKGGSFFVQLPSTEKMSNTSVLFQPTGFFESYGMPLFFFLRIVTNLASAGTIQLDGATINALQFKHVPNSNFYYYETATSNTTHSVTTSNPGTQYSVMSYTYGSVAGCGFTCAFNLPVGNPIALTSAQATIQL
uniref:IgGFc-binding protein N-terminal domain-containing protein n=1 Tax=Plectus sambesii TaxID=2011161 RepID=A0A914X6J9_9BILA